MPRSTIERRCAVAALSVLAIATGIAGCSSSPSPVDQAPQHDLAFTVDGHGTADITWSGANGGTASHQALPWHISVREPDGPHPVSLQVVLGQTGGQAACTIDLDGKRISSSLAAGKFGRATCHTPAADATRSHA